MRRARMLADGKHAGIQTLFSAQWDGQTESSSSSAP
jgi:hypothetical protein